MLKRSNNAVINIFMNKINHALTRQLNTSEYQMLHSQTLPPPPPSPVLTPKNSGGRIDPHQTHCYLEFHTI